MDTDKLEAYRSGEILANWEGFVSAANLEATRTALRQLATNLISAAPDCDANAVGKLFVACVQRFNELDSADQFICTAEREDLCEEFYTIGDLCGFSDEVDDWLEDRDW